MRYFGIPRSIYHYSALFGVTLTTLEAGRSLRFSLALGTVLRKKERGGSSLEEAVASRCTRIFVRAKTPRGK